MKQIISIAFFTLTFASYNIGDYISNNHLNQEFEVCYPSSMDNAISLGDYNGNTNGGDYNILVIDASAILKVYHLY